MMDRKEFCRTEYLNECIRYAQMTPSNSTLVEICLQNGIVIGMQRALAATGLFAYDELLELEESAKTVKL